MSDNEDRRIESAKWQGRIEEKVDAILEHAKKTNGRLDKVEDKVGSLELSRARNAWLIRAAGVVGLAGAVKAFSGGGHEVLK